MLRSKCLLVIVLAVTTAMLSMARAGEPAADACRVKPGAAAPPGAHWFYRTNHTDNRHCWYLGAAALKAHSRVPAATARAASANEPPPNAAADPMPAAPAQTAQAAAPAQAAPAPPAPALSNDRSPLGFAVRWSDLTKPPEVDARMSTTPGIAVSGDEAAAYAVEPMPPPRSAARSNPLLDSATAVIMPILATVVLVMASLVIVGAGFVRRPFLRLASWMRQSRDGADDLAGSHATEQTGGGPSRPLPVPTDPARDVKASLRELMDDLRRADAADKSWRAAPRLRRIARRKGLSKPASVASPTAALPLLGGHGQSIWRAAETSSDTLVSETS